MGPDVVGVAVPAELVVGRDDVGLVAADEPHQAARRLVEIGPPEGARVEVPGPTHHVRVVVAEVLPLGHAQDPHRPFQLAGPDLGQPAVVVGRVHLRDDDLALLAARAGHEHDSPAGGDGLGHRAARPDRLVVGVGVDGHEGGSMGDLVGGAEEGVGFGHRLGILSQVATNGRWRTVSIVKRPSGLATMTVRDRLATSCLVMAVAIAACGASGSAPATAEPGESAMTSLTPELGGSQAPSGPVLDQPWATVPLTDVTTGETFQLADHAGKVIIIETMAIWCPNCLLQEREVNVALGRLGPDSVVYVVLDVDLHEDAAALASYKAEYGLTGSYVVSGDPGGNVPWRRSSAPTS